MLSWLFRLFDRDSRRGLFPYFDGKRYRKIDGLSALRAFYTLPNFDWDETPAMLDARVSTVELTAFKTIGEAVREVFGIPAVEKGGLTETGCWDLLLAFREYCDGVKKNTSLFPTPPTSTAAAQSEMLLPPPLLSASGSTASDPLPESAGLPMAGTIGPSISLPAVP